MGSLEAYPGFILCNITICNVPLCWGRGKTLHEFSKVPVPESKSYSSTDLGDGILDKCYGHGTLIMMWNTLALECLSLSLVLSTVVFREMPWLPKRWGCITAEAGWHVFPHRRLPNLNATMPHHCQPTNRTCRILRKQFSCPCLLLSQDLCSLLPRFSKNQARLTTHLAELCPGLLITAATFSAQIP